MTSPTEIRKPLPDAEQRRAALNLDRNVLVMAPAGSGKTGLLVSRMLLALARCEQPEQVVAITFTNKAAAEIRFRLLELLQAAERGEPGEHMPAAYEAARELLDHDRRRGWNLLDQPDRLRALTIDSFNAQLAGRQPLLSRLGGPVRVAEDARELYSEAVMRLFAELEDDELPVADRDALALVLRLAGNRIDRLIGPLSELLARREQWLSPVVSYDESVWDEAEAALLRGFVEQGLGDFHRLLGEASGCELVDLLREGASQHELLRWAETLSAWPPATLEHLPTFRQLIELLMTKDGRLRSAGGINVKSGFVARQAYTQRMKQLLESLAGDEALEAACQRLRKLPHPHYPPTLKDFQRALLRCLRRLSAHLLAVFGERGETDFSEIARSALVALEAGDDGVGEGLLWADRHIRHLLVDEMQDTSESQVQLLLRLTAAWEDGDGRSLFLVGDPQQSIYAFRKAEVRLFLQLWGERRLGHLPLSCLRLSANFRSSAAVVDWFNEALSAVFPKNADAERGIVPFAPSDAQRPAADGRVDIAAFGADEGAIAAEAAAEQAERLVASGASVVVLGRARPHLAPVIRALRARGLSPACQDIDPLATQPAVRDLVALARALWHPADRLHWALLLRAPFVGMSWADLVAISAGRTRWSWPDRIEAALKPVEPFSLPDSPEFGETGDLFAAPQAVSDPGPDPQPEAVLTLSAEGRARLQRLWDALAASAANPGLRLNLADRTEAVWHALGGAACVGADGLADVQAALRLLRRQTAGDGIADIAALDRSLAQLYAEPRAGQVQVMTVHKAKGLEFDHVLLVGCERKPRAEDKPLWHLRSWQAGEGRHDRDGHLLVPRPPESFDETDPAHALYDWLHRQHVAERRNEALRLLYVAVTRAKRSLTLYACADVGPKGPEFAAESFAGLLRARFAPAFEGRASVVPRSATATATLSPPPRSPRLPIDWKPLADADDALVYRPQERRTLKPSEGVLNAAEDKREERVAAPGDLYAQLVGTLYHEALERIAAEGIEAWADGGDSRRGALSSGFRRLGLPEPQVEKAVDRVLELVRRTLSSPRGRWLLGPKPWARNEYHLAGYQGGQWVAAVIDRCFEDDDGTLWIIDYKTSARPIEAGQVAAYVAEGVERYRSQLRAYFGLLRELRPGKILRTGLYFAEADRFEEIALS
ncbi:UvrD-helicase domain-containing protein [Hydrocarboniphaga effusa]|uniref:UvrD-helicase domain-containing protein n=1 Tax=Hydrocarboniphaga effusa TaxID=243629 RepID=UPI0035B24640